MPSTTKNQKTFLRGFRLINTIFLFLSLLCSNQAAASSQEELEEIQILDLDIISYDDFMQNDPQALTVLHRALHEKGIVGIKGIPGYLEKVHSFVQQARAFTSLSEETKNQYIPRRDLGEMFLGYESGKERFKRPDGQWVIDDLKISYYAFVPDVAENKWPVEVDLKHPFEELATLMSEMGQAVMRKIGLLGSNTNISLNDTSSVGRMLYYKTNEDNINKNPFWCGAHFDHGLFTALLPAFYFLDGKPTEEPIEAGLFVKTHWDNRFKKVVSDPGVLLFQAGEFGQLATDDQIKATEHRVHKANNALERYTMALFLVPKDLDIVIHSFSALTSDQRYGGILGAPCSYRQWEEGSFRRYLVTESKEDFE